MTFFSTAARFPRRAGVPFLAESRQSADKGYVRRNLAIRRLLIGFCIVTLSWGCAKKVERHGTAFDLDKIITDQQPAVEENWRETGIRLAKEHNFEEAAHAFMNYAAEEPENFAGFNALAVCYKNLGDHSNAMKNFERALEFADSPEERAKVLGNIGNLYYSAGKYQVALGYYKEAAAEFDKNPLYLLLVARTFSALGEMDRASKVLAAAEADHKRLGKYETDEDRGHGYFLIAEIYASLNNEQKVYEWLETAIKTNPERTIRRIRESIEDEKSLLYTLKDDPVLKKIIDKYSIKSATRTVSIQEKSRRGP